MYSPFIFNTLNSKDVNDHVHPIASKKHVEQRAQCFNYKKDLPGSTILSLLPISIY